MLDAPLAQTPARWELYRVLSEPVRLRLLALAAAEELAIGELAELLGESQPNVSRHVAPLRQAGLVTFRKEGTRTLVRLREGAAGDAVIQDALASGRALCTEDGSLGRIADILRARDTVGREFFSKAANGAGKIAVPSELGAYLAALAPLLPRRSLAIDAGTGDGGLLEVLAPVYEKVIGVDREEAQLARAKERVLLRGWDNVKLVHGELDSPEVRGAASRGACAVFASRLLHHAPRPQAFLAKLAALVADGGALVVIDYAPHDDEAMREQADLWLGFAPKELVRLARAAGLEGPRVSQLPGSAHAGGPDKHLGWQVMVAEKRDPVERKDEKRRVSNG